MSKKTSVRTQAIQAPLPATESAAPESEPVTASPEPESATPPPEPESAASRSRRSTRTRAVQAPPPAPEAPPPAPAPTPSEDFTRVIARHWVLAAVVTIVVTLAVWVIASLQTKRYRASSIAAVSPLSEMLTATDLIRGVDTLERRVVVSSLAALAGAPVTRRQTRASSDYVISAAVLPNTNLVRIDVEGPDARRAAVIANEVPSVLAAQSRAMYRLYGVSLVSEATAPSRPATPRMERALAAGLLLGAFLGMVAAWLRGRRRA